MFCIITPVFDAAFLAVDGLINDLKEQTFSDFKQILVSNGESKIIKKNVIKADDSRFVYMEYPFEKVVSLEEIVTNIAKRRNYGIERCVADRYFFFDADLLLTRKDFLEKVNKLHERADVIISEILVGMNVLPKPPIQKGNIDIANYSFSRKMAEKYKYPIDYNLKATGIANDWRFYEQMIGESHYFNDMIYAKKDGRAAYRNLSARFIDERMRGVL